MLFRSILWYKKARVHACDGQTRAFPMRAPSKDNPREALQQLFDPQPTPQNVSVSAFFFLFYLVVLIYYRGGILAKAGIRVKTFFAAPLLAQRNSSFLNR